MLTLVEFAIESPSHAFIYFLQTLVHGGLPLACHINQPFLNLKTVQGWSWDTCSAFKGCFKCFLNCREYVEDFQASIDPT